MLSKSASNSSITAFASKLLCLFAVLNHASAEFDPYQMNGGLVSAIAGKDFSIVATDTRMIGEGGYQLASRRHITSRLWSVQDALRDSGIKQSHLDAGQMSNDVGSMREVNIDAMTVQQHQISAADPLPIWIASSGCSADCEALKRVIQSEIRAASYFGSTKSSSVSQAASLLSQTLYLRRGFPYYSFCIVSGLGEEGGAAYGYDAIGSYERLAVTTAGTGRELLQPILDRTLSVPEKQVKSMQSMQPTQSKLLHVQCTADEAVHRLIHAYRSVSEREIGVGDQLVIYVTERNKTNGSGDADDEAVINSRVILVPLKEH